MTPNANYTSGRSYEYKTMRCLRDRGYECHRTAGSHSPFDVIARCHTHVLWVQVKSGETKPTKAERKQIQCESVPPRDRKELWYWKPYAREPEVQVVD